MLKVIELFSGVGCQREALNRIGVKHQVVGIAEIDNFAIDTYTQLHGETKNFGDISKINELPYADLWTYSFPCQDLSVNGKGAGIKKGTRSGLLFEVERLLGTSEKPKYLLMENVRNLVSKKFKPDFDKWCEKLEALGYTNYWQVLNAKDCGIPQNRERVFMVSILEEGHKPYEFPKTMKLSKKIQDYFEDNVEEKYKHVTPSCKKNFEREMDQILISDKDIYTCTITSGFSSSNRVALKICPTILTSPKIWILQNKEIRKLTPRECWRLMGWTDERFDQIKGISDTQLYKQAGNGIVVDVLCEIFTKLFK